jgi:DNA-binding NtrC family response regulator
MDVPIPILVVSSESKNRYALMEILDREGWKTVCASTASECKEVFRNHNIHVVFCERSLSDGTYRDLLTVTRLQGRSVCLIVTSRLANWDEYLEALNDGAFDLIASPSQTTDVVRVLNQAHREDKMTGASVPADNGHTASAETLA